MAHFIWAFAVDSKFDEVLEQLIELTRHGCDDWILIPLHGIESMRK